MFNHDLLKVYYQMLFPHDTMFKWLAYDARGATPTGGDEDENAKSASNDYFTRREFSFTLADDVYIRYLTFKSADALKTELHRLTPHKIDIGAVYNIAASNKTSVASNKFIPLERELVFDIDLDDYDSVRVGCDPSDMWVKQSWKYMSLAVKLLDDALRNDFGFEHIFYVYSGRRGVHCWVCDHSARILEDRQRKAIVSYLSIVSGSGELEKVVSVTDPLHPMVRRALPICREMFNKVVLPEENGQGLLADPERWAKVLRMIPNEQIRTGLENSWEKTKDLKGDEAWTSEKRWKQLEQTVEQFIPKQQKHLSAIELQHLKLLIPRIVLLHTYMRLDVNVSTHRNHLLKSPFVVHPKTGNVCVPLMSPEEAENFQPNSCPNLSSLINQVDDPSKSSIEDKLDRTDMKEYMSRFESGFLKNVISAERKRLREVADRRAAADNDW